MIWIISIIIYIVGFILTPKWHYYKNEDIPVEWNIEEESEHMIAIIWPVAIFIIIYLIISNWWRR